MARLIGEDLTRDVMGLHEDKVGHGVGWFLDDAVGLQQGLRCGD